jgi:hypothetical protein
VRASRWVLREAGGEIPPGLLARESAKVSGADAVSDAEGNMTGRDSASARTTRRGRRHWHVRTLFVREPRDLMVDQDGKPPLARIGKARSRSR